MKILVISDMCGVGNCSLVANIGVLTHLGHKVSPLSTSIFSCNTAYDFCKYLSNDRLWDFYLDIEKSQQVNAVLGGFATDTNQLQAFKRIVERQKMLGGLVVVDPIMADHGKLYSIYKGDFVVAMKDYISGANLITPNLTEACLLLGLDYSLLHQMSINEVAEELGDILPKLNVENAVVTGVEQGNIIANLVITKDGTKIVTTEKLNGQYAGTGDIFCSVVTGKILSGESLYNATVVATQFVYNSIAVTDSASDCRCGVDFEKVLYKLK